MILFMKPSKNGTMNAVSPWTVFPTPAARAESDSAPLDPPVFYRGSRPVRLDRLGQPVQVAVFRRRARTDSCGGPFIGNLAVLSLEAKIAQELYNSKHAGPSGWMRAMEEVVGCHTANHAIHGARLQAHSPRQPARDSVRVNAGNRYIRKIL